MKFLSLMMCLFLISCANINRASPKLDTDAKNFSRNKKKAGLYIYRNQPIRINQEMKVSINGELIGQTGYKTFLYIELDPGKYLLQDDSGNNKSSLEIELKPNTNTFVLQSVNTEAIFSYQSRLIKVHESEGKQAVLECDRVISVKD